jgi:hypothetical protein
MAQLSDDCFAFSGPLLPIADMERLIIERVAPVVEVEQAPLSEALGRVVATDIVAPEDLPPFDNSAVDGFAVRHMRRRIRSRPGRPFASSPAPRCRPAPTPCSCRRIAKSKPTP